MKTPDLPQNEQERLSTLQSLTILDSAPDERFDRLTRIAIKLFDVPVDSDGNPTGNAPMYDFPNEV